MSLHEGYDLINITELMNFMNDFYKEHVNSKKTLVKKDEMLRMFLSALRRSPEYDKEDAWPAKAIITAFGKVMSGNHPKSLIASSCLQEEFSEEQKKAEPSRFSNIERFRENAIGENGAYQKLVLDIFSSGEIDLLFSKLRSMCREPHFTEKELSRYDEWVSGKQYDEFFHAVMYHAFSCAYYNLQYMYAERLYQEAITLKIHNKMREDMLKEAADNGHKGAALEYAMRVYEDDLEAGFKYNLIATPQLAAYWCMAFDIETQWDKVTDRTLKTVKKELKKTVLDQVEKLRKTGTASAREREFFVDVVPVVTDKRQKECLELALQIYQYLCTYTRFSKAFNSIGKLLLIGKIRVRSEEEQREESDNVDLYPLSRKEAFRFLDQAIATGNASAVVNKARYYTKRVTSPIAEIREEALMNYDISVVKLKEMAELHEPVACEFYGQVLQEQTRIGEGMKAKSEKNKKE